MFERRDCLKGLASTMSVWVLPSRQVIESVLDIPETSSPDTNNSLRSLC